MLTTHLTLINSPASAGVNSSNLIRATLLGDSYSAGNGAGSYYGPKDTYRSHKNWAHNYVNWLNDQGAPTVLTNLAHSGYTTDQVLNEQVNTMEPNTNLVMFTIGGNDVNFSEIVKQCFTPGMRDAASCKSNVDNAKSSLTSVKSQTLEILRAIDGRLQGDFQVILVGYPRLSTNTPFTLRSAGLSYNASAEVRSLSDSAKDTQESLVSEWNASHPKSKVNYIEGVADGFEGHEPSPGTRRTIIKDGLTNCLKPKEDKGRTVSQNPPSASIQIISTTLILQVTKKSPNLSSRRSEFLVLTTQ